MKQKAKLLPNTAQERLTNNLRTVGLAVLAGVICGAGVQPAHAQSDIAAAKRFVAPTVFQAAGPTPGVDSKYCGSVSCGARSCQQWQ